jgi:hypothetical protein
MISFVLSMICGYVLATKVRQVWLGLWGCIIGGLMIGIVATYATVYFYEHGESLRLIAIDHSRIPEAILPSAIKFTLLTLMFYCMAR